MHCWFSQNKSFASDVVNIHEFWVINFRYYRIITRYSDGDLNQKSYFLFILGQTKFIENNAYQERKIWKIIELFVADNPEIFKKCRICGYYSIKRPLCCWQAPSHWEKPILKGLIAFKSDSILKGIFDFYENLKTFPILKAFWNFLNIYFPFLFRK